MISCAPPRPGCAPPQQCNMPLPDSPALALRSASHAWHPTAHHNRQLQAHAPCLRMFLPGVDWPLQGLVLHAHPLTTSKPHNAPALCCGLCASLCTCKPALNPQSAACNLNCRCSTLRTSCMSHTRRCTPYPCMHAPPTHQQRPRPPCTGTPASTSCCRLCRSNGCSHLLLPRLSPLASSPAFRGSQYCNIRNTDQRVCASIPAGATPRAPPSPRVAFLQPLLKTPGRRSLPLSLPSLFTSLFTPLSFL